MSHLEIYSLSEKPEYAKTCAAWSYGEWGCHYKNNSLEKTLAGYENRTKNTKKLPLTWVGVFKNKIVGMVSLKENDHEDHKDLTPWLASMYVHSEFRKKGHATKLIQHIHQEAKRLNYNHLYLFTPNAEKLYEKNGWKVTAKVRDPRGINDHEKLMEIDL